MLRLYTNPSHVNRTYSPTLGYISILSFNMIVFVILLNENVFLYTPIASEISELLHLAHVNINLSQYDSVPLSRMYNMDPKTDTTISKILSGLFICGFRYFWPLPRNLTFLMKDLKNLKHRSHSWIGHIIWHKEFVVNILEGAISGKKGREKTSTTILKESRQKHSYTAVLRQ